MSAEGFVKDIFKKLRSQADIYSEIVERAKRSDNSAEQTPAVNVPYNEFPVQEEDVAELEPDCDSLVKNAVKSDAVVGEQRVVDRRQALESLIANRLRKCCNLFGKEKRDMLDHTIECLVQLGQVYLDYAFDGGGVEQNLNFIRASALIVGSLVRCEITKNPLNYDIVKNQLLKLHNSIMKTSHVKGDKKIDIFEFSNQIKRLLRNYREDISAELKTIPRIDKGGEEDIDVNAVKIKASHVRDIYEKSTKYYISIMKKIAEKCVEIMGPPPCGFCVIGFGSTSRKEATLFSDFEHGILLDDTAGDDPSTKQYFRWFTTIFQIIVIGLGETVIPSVGIKSLNDFYSSDRDKKWFSDEYTPLGVCFDGMMPHACKIPLGRQEVTSRRGHTVELIQKVEKMVSFLTKEQETKNGYFLSDVLSKVCFVYGCRELHEAYHKKSQELLNSKTQRELAKQQLGIIRRNPNTAIRESDVHNLISDGKIKTSSYRPLTALLSIASALHRIQARSSFEIVEELRRVGVISDETHSALTFAVATAMEIRLKTYHSVGHQRQVITVTELSQLVGRKSLVHCYSTIYLWRKVILSEIYEMLKGVPSPDKGAPKDHGICLGEDIFILLLFRKYRQAMSRAVEFISQTSAQFKTSKVSAVKAKERLKVALISLLECFPLIYTDTPQENVVDIPTSELQDWKWVCEILRECSGEDDPYANEVVHSCLGEIYLSQNDMDRAREEKRETARYRTERWKRDDRITDISVIQYRSYLNSMLQLLGPEEILSDMNESMRKEESFGKKCALRIGMCQALFEKGMAKEAKENLRELTKDIERNANHLGKFLFHFLLSEIRRIQTASGLFVDLFSTSELLFRNSPGQTQYSENCETKLDPSATSKRYEKPHIQKVLAAEADRVNLIHHEALEEFWSGGTPEGKLFASFSYKELLLNFAHILLVYNAKSDGDSRPKSPLVIYPVTFCAMGFCEIILPKDWVIFMNFIISCGPEVRSVTSLQPFLYACFADLFARSKDLKSNTVQAESQKQFSRLVAEQNIIVRYLFKCSADKPILFRNAMDHFTELKLNNCVVCLWRQMHLPLGKSDAGSESIELFVTALLTILVFRKRQNPTECFRKTRELSLRQSYFVRGSLSDEENIFKVISSFCVGKYCYRTGNEDKLLVQVYNLAVECSFYSMRKGITLLWKLLHAEKVTPTLLEDSIVVFCHDISFLCSLKSASTFQNLLQEVDTLNTMPNDYHSALQTGNWKGVNSIESRLRKHKEFEAYRF